MTHADDTLFVAQGLPTLKAAWLNTVNNQVLRANSGIYAAAASRRTLTQRFADTPTAKDHGAVGDGVTDDTAALQRFLDASGGYLPPGQYKVTSTLVANFGYTHVFGAGMASTILTNQGTGDVLQLSAPGIVIDDIFINASVTRTAGWYINLNAPTNNTGTKIRGCTLFAFFNGINMSGNTSSTVSLESLNLSTAIAGGTGILLGQPVLPAANWVDVSLTDILVAGPVGNLGIGISVINVGDIILDNVLTVQCAVGLQIAPANGQTAQLVIVSNSDFDSGISYGISAIPAVGGQVQLLKINNCWAATNAYGIILAPANLGSVLRTEIVNCSCSNNTTAGIHLGGSAVTNTSILGGSMGSNVDGIKVAAGTTKFQIDNVRAGPNGQFVGNSAYGINLVAGATDDFSITNCDLQGNTTAGLLEGSSGVNKVIAGNRGYATRTSGASTIAVGSASRVITHGLAATPTIKDILITDGSNRVSSGILTVWVSAIGATTFQVNSDVNVATTAFVFGWKATIGQG